MIKMEELVVVRNDAGPSVSLEAREMAGLACSKFGSCACDCVSGGGVGIRSAIGRRLIRNEALVSPSRVDEGSTWHEMRRSIEKF